jgi:hypothetical protein
MGGIVVSSVEVKRYCIQILSWVGGIAMVEYRFEIIKAEPLKGRKLEGSNDYITHVQVIRDGKTLMDENIRVRKNPAGVFPEQDIIRKKLTAPSMQKELTEKLKKYIKKQK